MNRQAKVEAGNPFRRCRVVALDLTVAQEDQVADCILEWARAGESRTVCAANVHMTMEGWDVPAFREVVNGSDLVTPDGTPLVWGMRLMGMSGQERVCGPDLMLALCHRAAAEGLPVGLYGSTPETLEALVHSLKRQIPDLGLPFVMSPPFRALSDVEKAQVVQEVQRSGVRLLFVGLGCPKQERWMAEHRGKIPAVMLGVGAAFDFHAGKISRAPRWMSRAGLEWVYRLACEPRRLAGRYLRHNPRFVYRILAQVVARG